MCQELAELTSKLGEEKNNSVSAKKLTVQLQQELADIRDQLEKHKREGNVHQQGKRNKERPGETAKVQ